MIFTLDIDLVILVILVGISAFFSSAETAFISMNRIKIKRLVEMKAPGAKLLQEMKSRQQKVLITILIANNLVNFTIASLAAAVALEVFKGDFGIAISTGLVTFFILVFAEITPKSIALRHARLIATNSAPLLYFLSWVFSPLISVLEWIAGFFTRIFGVDVEEQRLSEEEVKAAVSVSAEEGSILAEEKDMIHRIFLLNDITASQVMVPRGEIVAVKAGTLVRGIRPAMLKAHNRIPVYGRDIDDIKGVFYQRDYLGSALGMAGNIHVEKLMRKALFVHRARKLDSLLKEFKAKKVNFAVVVDSEGATAGIVTVEDILAEIVGDIRAG